MRWFRSPVIPAVVIGVGLIARWLWVVGYGDFGTDYDFGSRLLAGQWPGRDFYSVFPPSWAYSLLIFLWLAGGQYVAVNIHLWLWWVVNAIVGAVMFRVAGGSRGGAVAVGLGVALLTAPPNTHAASFAFMASALAGGASIAFLRFLRTWRAGWAWTVGLLSGVCVFVKPNVGLAMGVAAAGGCWAAGFYRGTGRSPARWGAAYVVLGLVGGAALALVVPGAYGGYSEILREVFGGGIEIKGGFVTTLLRAVPRLATTVEGPTRYVIEAGITAPVLAGAVAASARLFGSTSPRETGPGIGMLWVLAAGVYALSLWSLGYADFPHLLTRFFYEWQLTSLPFFLWQVLYVLVFGALAVVCVRGVFRREWVSEANGGVNLRFWLAVLAFVWTVAVVASGRHNIIFASTLFLPALGLQVRGAHPRRVWNGFLVALFCWTLAWHVAPNWRSSFGRLTPLPAGSRFSGLYWPDGAAGGPPQAYPVFTSSRIIAALHEHLTPRVQGSTVLWLVGGPGPAFGGKIYRYGIFGFAANGITFHDERMFATRLKADPPLYIVSSTFDEWRDTRWSFMRPELIEQWLHERYRLLWAMPDNPAPLFLWEKRQKSRW